MGVVAVLFSFLHDSLRCKRHAAGALPGVARGATGGAPAQCSTLVQPRAAAAQGQPWARVLALVGLLVPLHTTAACEGPALVFEPLAPGLWWLPAAADGDADAGNRGHVSHLLLAEDGRRLWLVGSGPSPAFGRRLVCQVRERFGRAPTDVISPWPRPELVLGLAGLGAVRSWAHADVAQAMRSRCPGCVARLRERLGAAAADLGAQPVRVPGRLLHGHQGRLGPWRWWRASRGPGSPVTLWQWQGSDLRFAPGLLWGSGVPDGRDAQLATLAAATAALPADVPRWLGEQGPLMGASAPAEQARYWQQLRAAVRAAQARGEADTGTPPPVPGLPEALARDPRHALNGQRLWRQEEAQAEGEPGASPPPGPQRSLR